jgi:protein-S-isoprenylcysteine O-methyltransferase Ste14
VAAGTAGFAWTVDQHSEAAPGGYQFGVTPAYLLRHGPYRFSRNPMYLSELLVWTGWTLLLRDRVLGAATGVLGLLLDRGVRREEAGLSGQFGETWRAYAAATPRWIGPSTFSRPRSGY